MKLFFVAIILSFSGTPLCYKQLSWSDYRGVPPSNPQADACTCTNIVIGESFAYAVFVPEKSWTRTDDKELLKHEQLHFDITQRIAKRILAHIKEKRLTDISTDLEAWRRLQAMYDEDTAHGKNIAAQKRWELFLYNL